MKVQKNKIYDSCQMGKRTKSSFKSKTYIPSSGPLELLHIDLFGHTRTSSLRGKWYAFVGVDDFSTFIWVFFLARKMRY